MPENNTNVLENYSERSYIKNILIEIPKYRFNHHPLEGESEEQNKYTGRSKIEEQFLEILEKGNKKGAYLISGYRGMGKTSFVKKVVNQYKENVAPEEKIVTLNLSFAQSDLKSEDLLKQLIQAIITKSEESLWIRITNLFSLGSIFRSILFIFFGLIICNQFEIIDLNSFELFKGFNELFNFDEILNKKTTTDSKTSQNHQIIYLDKLIALVDMDPKTSENQPNIYLDKLIAIGALALWISYFLYFARKITLFVFQNIFLPLINLKELILNPSLKNIRRLKKIIKKFIIKILPGLSISFSIYFIIHSILLKEYSGIIFPTLLLLISLLFIKGFLYELIIAEREIIIKLKKLLLRCNASIVEENGFESNFWDKLPFSLSSKNSHAYPIANSKEIENDLIEILAEYKKFNSYKKSFIVIFDELDKVEQTIDKTINYQDFQINKNEGSLNETRDRKITIINILSSLKYFVTEANARFIFIAGREMFDAALADIADRQSFISSIFHNVLYVDSFLKDGSESNNSGLTNLVEDYLSRILLNPYKKEINKTEIPFLKEYYDFLTKSNSHYLLPDYHLSEEEKMKIIFTLQNFIIYITYRSNGSPKKISKIIEDHIVPFNWKAKYESDKGDIKKQRFKYIYVRARKNIRNEEKMLCLKLNYHDQYRFGFISHLFRPFIMNFSQHAKRLSDNVLVAMPYLMDHIIKFHPFAFSNQNLELLPEVISANRNPIVRNFIDELLDYLRQSHLSQTEMGLFDYKFVSKTANEINYISKVFEEESAAFNFSLDEMYAIKVYLNNRIKEIRKNNKEMHGNAIYPSSIYSVSLLQALLGDTHYFDQEFDSAIVAYLDSLQTLRYENHNEVFNQEWLISNIRLKLKIGLIYERIKKYDMAGSYYNDAINEYLHYIKNCSKNLNFTNALDNCLQLVFQALMASLSINEKKSIQGLASETTLKYINKIDDIIRQNNISKSKFLPYSDFYNDLGNLYFYKNLANNHIKNILEIDHSELINYIFKNNNLCFEKITSTNKDFRVSLESLEYYSISLKNTLGLNKSLTLKDTFRKAADNLVNYDNIHDTNSLRLIGYSLSSIGNSFLSVYTSKKSKNSNIQFLIDYSKKWISVHKLLESIRTSISNKDLARFINLYKELDNLIKDEKLFGSRILSEILAVINSEYSPSYFNKLEKIFNLNSKKFRPMKFWDIMTEDFFTQDNQSDLELIVFSYYLAGRYYSKSGKTKQLGFQLKKILETLNNCIQKNDLKDSKNEFLKFIEETILSMILEAASWSSMSTDRPQIYKYKNYENLEKLNDGNHIIHPSKYTKHNYFNVSNTPETKEGILAMAMIKTKLADFDQKLETVEKIKDYVDNINELSLIHSYGSIFTQLTRIVELNLHTRINRIILKNVLKNMPELSDWESTGSIQYKNNNIGLKKYNIENIEIFEFICELVASSIFDIIQIIKIFQIYTTNPYLNYSYLAYFHKRLGRWLKYYSLCRLIEKNKGKPILEGNSSIDKKLAKLFGNSETLITLDSTSQYQIALQYLHKAKEMHSNGIAYHNELNKSIYLEGDFDDHLYHFGIALERQKINSGSLRDEIRDLEKEIVDSPLYKYDSYVNNEKIEI